MPEKTNALLYLILSTLFAIIGLIIFYSQTFENSKIIQNNSLIKFQNKNCNLNFHVLYLVQGKSLFKLPQWYKLFYDSKYNICDSLIFLYYNEREYINDSLILNNLDFSKYYLKIIKGFNVGAVTTRTSPPPGAHVS